VISRQFLAFLVAGGIAALANIGSRALFDLAMPYVPAIVLAYCVGMVTAFALNRTFVFRRSTRTLHHQAMWFVLVNLAAVVQTVVISVLLRDWLFPLIGMDFHPETVAHAVGVVVPVLTSYLGHRTLTFRSSGE
jgi:putative flippase GtrA